MDEFGSNDVVIYGTNLSGRMRTVVVDRDALLDFVVDQLLVLYNTRWRDADEPKQTPEQLRGQLELPEGSVESFLDDGGNVRIGLKARDLFCDHDVMVTIDATGLPLGASIE